MQYVKLGHSGLEVSRLCLGCMGFGDASRWIHPWVLDEQAAAPIVRRALELGINFFDTANVYAAGTSEEVLGKLLKAHGRRDELVIATKVSGRMHAGPNGAGLSRKAILSQIDHSLARLGTDHVDLYLVHRWDDATPIEETMEALHDLVKAGKVRYLGASSMSTWQFQQAQHVAERHGWTRFVVMQNHLNLIYREEEREMLPYCRAAGVAVTPYSPLASGRLVREAGAATSRSTTDQIARSKYDRTLEADQQVIDRVAQLAQRRGVSRTAIALAWLLHQQPVAAPIVGATRLTHLDEAMPALDVTLDAEELAELASAYVPHAETYVK